METIDPLAWIKAIREQVPVERKKLAKPVYHRLPAGTVKHTAHRLFGPSR